MNSDDHATYGSLSLKHNQLDLVLVTMYGGAQSGKGGYWNGWFRPNFLDGFNVYCQRFSGCLLNIEPNALSFAQRLESIGLNGASVNKYFEPFIVCNNSKSRLIVEKNNCSLRHWLWPPLVAYCCLCDVSFHGVKIVCFSDRKHVKGKLDESRSIF